MAARLFAADYGVAVSSQSVLRSEEGGEKGVVEWTGRLLPWFSSPLGDNADMFLSGGLMLRLERGEWEALPDVGRFELALRPLPDLGLELGRFTFSEPLGFVLSGMFDGLSASWNLGGSRLRAGAFYTGLLYKKNGYIIMNGSDLANHYDRDKYFASRRLVFALDWRHPSFLDSRNQLDLALLAQTDLNDTADELNTQYVLAQWSRPLGGGWYMRLGAALDIEQRDRDGDGGVDPGAGFAFSFAPFWVPAKRPGDRLFFDARLSSGNWNGAIRSFKPISVEAQGRVLRTRFSGLSWVEMGYSALLHRNVEAEIAAAYFFRTDREIFYDLDFYQDSDSPNLGGELHGELFWAPESFCKFNLGGGFFAPSPYGAYDVGAPLKWRVSTGFLFSF
jgi:hypothetical protein